ncbi:MAG: molybdopterin molybdotransferase MoeA [Nitrososphaeria archaeon]
MRDSVGGMHFKTRIFKILTGVEESLDIMFRSLPRVTLDVLEVDVRDSLHKFAAEDIMSRQDCPPYDRSAVDGYAVILRDVLSSSMTNPSQLKIVQEIFASSLPSETHPLSEGEAAIVYTGAPIPQGCEAVVMAEDAKREGASVLIYRPTFLGQNISRKGEDFERGSVVVKKNVLIRPWHLAALLSTGVYKIRVFRRLRVGIISTGCELKEAGSSSEKQIVNTTKPLLMSLLLEEFCEPIDLGTLPDEVNAISSSIVDALTKVDMILTTGGTSVGVTDLVAEAVESINGSKMLFHGVRMRPGRPTGLALVDQKPVFMLSGYPVASFTGFEVFVKPAIDFLRGSKSLGYPTICARLSRRLAKPVGVKAYVRVNVQKASDGGYLVEPLRLTGSGLLSTLTKGNGLLIVEEGLEGYDEGEEVEVHLFHPV